MKLGPPLGESFDWRGRDALSGPLAAAEDALARLDERLRSSPIAEGFISRTHFQDACASLWLAGDLVLLEDLVLHDARMDIRSPTHEVTRAQAALRTRRRIARGAPDWALSPEGLKALRGDVEHVTAEAGPAGEGDNPGDAPAPELPDDAGNDPLKGELAALEHALESSSKLLAGAPAMAGAPRDPLIYDPEGEEGERLEAWRRAAAAAQSEPPLLAAAILWDAWESDPPLERQAWLGNLLVPALLRQRQKTREHLLCLNSALRLVRGEKRRFPDRATRLGAFLEAIAAGGGRNEGPRPLAARAAAFGGQAQRPPLQLPVARLGGIDPGAADRLRRHDRGGARRHPARRKTWSPSLASARSPGGGVL